MTDVISYWSVTFAILAFSIMPGYAVSCFFKGLNDLERLSISFGLSYLIVLIMTPLVALGHVWIFRYLFFLIFITALCIIVYFYKKQSLTVTTGFVLLLGIFVIQLAVKGFAQVYWEYPYPGGDWFIHAFRIPMSFSVGIWEPTQDRTCLFSVLILAYHNILNTSLYSYWISQLFSCIANSALLFPAFLIAYKVFNKKVAFVAVTLMALNIFLFYETIYTWPKGLSNYFVLMMIYFLFFRQKTTFADSLLAGLWGAIAYLMHPLAIFYILGCIGALLIKKKLLTLHSFYFLLAMGITMIPYFSWSYYSLGHFFKSNMIYYPILQSPHDAYLHSPEEIIASFKATPVWTFLYNAVSNRLYNILSVFTNLMYERSNFSFAGHLPKALTFFLYVLSLVGIYKIIRKKEPMKLILLQVILISFSCTLIFIGFRQDDFINEPGMHATIALFIVFATYALYEIKDSIFRRLTVFTIFSYTFINTPIRFAYIIRTYNNAPGGKERYFTELGKTWHHVEGFDILRLVSAHFLINGGIEFLLNLLFMIMIVSTIGLYIYKKLVFSVNKKYGGK